MAKKAKSNLEKEYAKLLFINDQLVAEIEYIDGLLKLVGFEGGLATVKGVAEELLENELDLNFEI